MRYNDVYNMAMNARKILEESEGLPDEDLYGETIGGGSGSSPGNPDVEKLIRIVEEMKGEDAQGRFAFEYDEADGVSLNRLLVMTPRMRRLYGEYKDVAFMDATYKTNKHDMPLVIIGGVNNEGRNVVFAFGFVK